MTHRPSVAATPATPAPATGPATPTHGLSPSLLTSLQKRAAHLRSLLNSLPDVADAASPSPRPAPLVAPLAGQQQRAVGLHGANSAATAGAIGQHERGVVAEAGAPGQALTTRSRESSSGSAGGRIRPSDVRVSASQLAAAAASASAAFAAVREDGSLNSSPAKDTAASGAASDAGPDASMSTTGGAAASVAGVAEGGASRVLADSRDGEGLGQADRRAKLAGGPSVGRLPTSAYAPFIPEPTADGPESQQLQQTASMPGVEFSTEGQTFSAPRVLPQEQQLLPARFMPHPPAQPPAPLPQPGQPLHSDRQSGHAGAPSQRSASPAATAPPHHPAIPAPTRTEDAEPPSTAAVGAAGPVLLAGSSPSHAGRPDSHRGPSLALPVVRVPARTGAALQDDASQGQAAAVQGPQNHERRHQSVPPSAETLAFTSGSHFAAASAAAGAGVVAEDGQRPQPQGMSQSSDRAAGAAGTAVQTASGASADALGGGGKLADDYLQQPDARTSAAACGVDVPHAHLSEGVGSSDDGYQVRAQGREAALSEDVLAAAIAAARISAQAAFFSPGAQRAVPRQAGYSGRASSSGTPASPGGGGGGAYHRQPHVMGMGGISAAAAPYISHSPGAITPGTGTAASSVRSGFSPVRSPYDLLLHGGLTTGPAAVLLPVGPGSDAGRGAGSIVVPGGAARAAWSTPSTAGGSSVGVGSSGGGTSRARAGGARGTEAMGTEFFRRNNLLQRKRQQWAAQGQRERESESGVSTEHRLSLTGAGTAAVNKPHALRTGAADMGTPQAPIRSLEDLQRWAMRRDKRLAVLREEREVAERQLQESHPFQPTITEKSRRMVEAARARSPASRSQRPWAASPLPGSAAGGSIDGVVETADAAPAAAEQPTAQTTSKHPPQQPQQQQQQQDAIPLPGVPAAAAGDLLNALRGSRPWHTPPQAAAINAAAASLRSSVTTAAAVELLNAASTATAASPDRSEIHGKSQAGSRTAAPAKTPGKATATMTPGRAGGSGAAAAGGGTPSAAALLTAARHSRSRGRYSLAADTEAVVGAVAEAIEDAAAALRRTIEGSTSPRRSASGLVTRLRASGAANDVSAGRSAEGAAPQAVAAARTKGRQAEPPAAPRHAPGYQGATALAQQIGPQDSGSYAAAYGAHHQASAPAGLHGAPPILGTQQGVHAGTYYPASVDTAVRGVGSSGGGAGGSGGGATLPGVAPTPFTIVPDPRQPFPGYGAVGSSGVAATTFGAAAADGSSRPVSNSGWAAELMSGSRDSITVAASAGAASAAAAARQALAAGGGSRRSTRSTSGAGRSAAFAVAARRTSSSGGTGGGSAGGAEPGSASPVQRPQAPVAPHSPSPSSSPIPAFASPASAVRGSANNSSRMSRARVSWSDLVSGGEGGSGGGAAGAEPDPRRSAGGTSEGVGVAEGSALTTKPASGFMMGTVGAFRPSFDGASSRGMATTLPAPTVLTTAMEPPVATSFTVLPLVAGSHGELRTPHATLHGQGEPHQRQQQEQQGSLGPRPGPQTQAVAAPTAAAPDIYSYPARGGSAMSAVAAALAVEASSTTDSPGTGSHHDPAATTAGGSVPTGAASFMPTALGAAAYQHVPAVALPAVQETSDGGASSRARSHDASAGGAVSEPSFAAMPWSAARSVAVGSSSGGGAKSATRGLSPSDGTSVFGAVTLTLNNDAGQAEPPATPPPLTPAPEEHNVEATRQRHQELEGRKDSLAVALEAALLAAAAAATAAAASAEKGRKLAAGGDAVTTDAAVERIETLAVAHTDRSPATQMAVCNDANGSGATLRVKGAVTESVAPPASASIAAGANNELGNALIDSEPSSPVHTRHVPLSSVHSTEGINEAHVSAARAPVVKQPAAAASDVPAPPVSQMALATAAALAMRARPETSLQAIAAPGTVATGTSAALGLEGVPGELAVSGRAELHSGLILAMTAAGPVHVPLGGGTSVSAGGAVAATPSPSYASASSASAPRDARGVAFTRLPASNPSSAASTPRKMSASLSMSAAHSLAAAAAATAAAAGASSSAGGAPPALPHVSQQSALLRGYASAGGAPDMHPRPSSPLRPVGSVRKHGLALPPGVDGLALSSTCPASPPNGVMASAAMLVDVAAGITPPGASSSRRRSSLLSAGGPVERPLVQSCPVSVTSPQEPAQVDNSAGAEADALLAIRHARSPVAALVSAGLMPQREPEGQQHQERQQQWLTEQQVEPEATKAHDDGNEGDPLQTLLRRIEALRSGSAAVVANLSASSDARSEAGSAAGAAAALTAPGSAAAAAQKAHTGNQSADTPVRLADRISGVVSSPGAAELSLDALVQRAELARAAALMAAMEPEVKSPPPRSSDALQHGTAPAALTAARHANGVSPSSNAPTPRHQAAEADTAVESPAPSEAQPSAYSMPRQGELPSPGLCDMQGGVEAEAEGVPEPMRSSWSLADYVPSTGATRSQR